MGVELGWGGGLGWWSIVQRSSCMMLGNGYDWNGVGILRCCEGKREDVALEAFTLSRIQERGRG